MSGRKNTLTPFQIFNATTMAASATSPVIVIAYMDNIGIQLQWTGAPVGTFSFEISLDYAASQPGGAVSNTGTWIPLAVSPSITASGSADQAYVEINQSAATAIRIKYTRTSGTGALTGYISAKQV